MTTGQSPSQEEGSEGGGDPPVIVVGVSSGSGSPTALRWAADEARLRGAELLAVRAWRLPRPPSAPAGRPPGVQRDVAADRARAEQDLAADVAATLGDDHDARCELVRGTPLNALVTASRDALMLVLDAPRRSNVTATTVLANRLVHRVACPLVVMPHPLTRPGPGAVARTARTAGSRLARSAATAGRPGVRVPQIRDG